MDKIDFAFLAGIDYKIAFTLGWVFVCSYSSPVLRFRQFWFCAGFVCVDSVSVSSSCDWKTLHPWIHATSLALSIFLFSPPPNQKLICNGYLQWNGKSVSPVECQWTYRPHSRGHPRIDVYLYGGGALFYMRVWVTEPNLVDSKYIKNIFK